MTPLPHPKTGGLFKKALGGSVWVSNGLLVWSILTWVVVVACSITILFFQARRRIHPMPLGGYCRL